MTDTEQLLEQWNRLSKEVAALEAECRTQASWYRDALAAALDSIKRAEAAEAKLDDLRAKLGLAHEELDKLSSKMWMRIRA